MYTIYYVFHSNGNNTLHKYWSGRIFQFNMFSTNIPHCSSLKCDRTFEIGKLSFFQKWVFRKAGTTVGRLYRAVVPMHQCLNIVHYNFIYIWYIYLYIYNQLSKDTGMLLLELLVLSKNANVWNYDVARLKWKADADADGGRHLRWSGQVQSGTMENIHSKLFFGFLLLDYNQYNVLFLNLQSDSRMQRETGEYFTMNCNKPRWKSTNK